MTVLLDSSLKDRIIKAVDKVENVLKITLGPLGRNVLLHNKGDIPMAINDGDTIIKSLSFEDSLDNLICNLLKEVAYKTNEEVGDGTTSSVVLASSIIRNLLRVVQEDTNVYEVQRGLKQAYRDIETRLIKKAIPLKDGDVYSVAMVSTGGNEDISRLLSEGFNKIEGIPAITIEPGQSTESEVNVVQGMQFDNGFVSPYLCTDPELLITEINDGCLVLLVDGAINSIQEIISFMEYCVSVGKPGLILADNIETEPLTLLIQNFQRGVTNIHFVKSPDVGETRKDILRDIAAMTGAEVVDKEIVNLADTEFQVGLLHSVRITSKETILVSNNTPEIIEAIRNRAAVIEREIAEVEHEYLKDKFVKRLARLKGGIVKLKVGAHTEAELIDKKLRVEDAVNACRAAIEQGVITGGGIALLEAKQLLPDTEETFEFKLGYNAVINALDSLFYNVLYNAGLKPDKYEYLLKEGQGVDLNTGDIIDNAIENGILDPVKVVLSSLKNACSIAGLLSTAEVAIYKDK